MNASSALPRRSAAEQELVDAAIRNKVHTVEFNRVLGVVAESVRQPNVRIRLDMKQALLGTPEQRRLHGGVIATILDIAGGIAVFAAVAEKFAHETNEQVQYRMGKLGTLDLRVDSLRPGWDEYFIATGAVSRLGGSIGSVQMRLVNDDDFPIATGAATFIVS